MTRSLDFDILIIINKLLGGKANAEGLFSAVNAKKNFCVFPSGIMEKEKAVDQQMCYFSQNKWRLIQILRTSVNLCELYCEAESFQSRRKTL